MVKWSRKKNRETDGEHDKDCVEKEFQLTKGEFDRDGEEDREAVGTGYCSINILDGLELKSA